MARSGVAVKIMCCVQDILREARGWRCCGLDRTVWIFLLAHGSGLALLLCTDTDLSLRVSGVRRRASPGARCTLHQGHHARVEDRDYLACHQPLLCPWRCSTAAFLAAMLIDVSANLGQCFHA